MDLENMKYALVEEELKNVGSDLPYSNEEDSEEDSSEVSPESDYNVSDISSHSVHDSEQIRNVR